MNAVVMFLWAQTPTFLLLAGALFGGAVSLCLVRLRDVARLVASDAQQARERQVLAHWASAGNGK